MKFIFNDLDFRILALLEWRPGLSTQTLSEVFEVASTTAHKRLRHLERFYMVKHQGKAPHLYEITTVGQRLLQLRDDIRGMGDGD